MVWYQKVPKHNVHACVHIIVGTCIIATCHIPICHIPTEIPPAALMVVNCAHRSRDTRGVSLPRPDVVVSESPMYYVGRCFARLYVLVGQLWPTWANSKVPARCSRIQNSSEGQACWTETWMFFLALSRASSRWERATSAVCSELLP